MEALDVSVPDLDTSVPEMERSRILKHVAVRDRRLRNSTLLIYGAICAICRRDYAEASGNTAVMAPVFSIKDRTGPLSRPQAIESFAAIIAQLLATSVDTATEIGLEILARLAGDFVMTELLSSFEGERSAP